MSGACRAAGVGKGACLSLGLSGSASNPIMTILLQVFGVVWEGCMCLFRRNGNFSLKFVSEPCQCQCFSRDCERVVLCFMTELRRRMGGHRITYSEENWRDKDGRT